MTKTDLASNASGKATFIGLALAVVVLAGLLRFINLDLNPGWYSDEGTIVDIAQNLLAGKTQYLALNRSTLLAARLPLFPAVLAGLFAIFGASITVLRFLTAGLGVLTVTLVIVCIRDILGRKGEYLALAAGFLLAVYPQAVLYSRLGFSYNILAPLTVFILWASYKYLGTGRKGTILAASLLIGIGALSDIMMFTLAPALFAIVIYRNWKDLPILFAAVLAPFLVYAAVMGAADPAAFRFDFIFTFFRLGSIPLIAQYPYVVFNYAALVLKDYWWVLSVTGMFLLADQRLRYLILILFLGPLFALGRTAALPGLGYYYLIPLFPLFAIGAGGLLVAGVPVLFRVIREGAERFLGRLVGLFSWQALGRLVKPGVFLINALLIFVIALSPFVITAALGVYQASAGIRSDIDSVLVDVSDAREALEYVNSRTARGDLVLASPALAWALEANAADFQMALAYEGLETLHFPPDIPRDRFSFPVDFREADFVIVDPIWTNWAAVNMDEVALMLSEITVWPLAAVYGEVAIYQNPDL